MAMALGGGPKWLGAITPVGGLGLIAGWALIITSRFCASRVARAGRRAGGSSLGARIPATARSTTTAVGTAVAGAERPVRQGFPARDNFSGFSSPPFPVPLGFAPLFPMEVFRIIGGRPLNGEVRVNGAKYAALPLLAATLLTRETCELRNVPNLSDVRFMLEILRHHGASVETPEPGVVRVTATDIHPHTPYELVRKMRASICLLGPLVGRLKVADIAQPGGCVIGTRPIDLHLKGLARLGCVVTHHAGYIAVDAGRARGGRVFLGGPNGSTVTGTANLVMAAVLTPGETVIDCAACEPEVADLCAMLTRMGADIDGAGGPTLRIRGVDALRGVPHTVVSDRIEAGTHAIAAAMAGGEVTVRGARADHLGAFLDKFEEAGVDFDVPDTDTLRVRGSAGRLKPVDIVTLPHPGFPTDLQAQFTAMLTMAGGALDDHGAHLPEPFHARAGVEPHGRGHRRRGGGGGDPRPGGAFRSSGDGFRPARLGGADPRRTRGAWRNLGAADLSPGSRLRAV